MSTNIGQLRVRPAEHCDYPTFQQLYPELATGDLIPTEECWQRDLMSSTQIAETDQGAVGYVHYQLLGTVGYVRQLVIAKEARRRGYASTLLRHVSEQLLASGAQSWCLNVKVDNGAALGLYEQLGLRASHRAWALTCDSACFERLPKSGAARAYGVAPSDDAALEYQFALPTGLLALSRASGRVLAQLRSVEGGRRLGIAVFDRATAKVMPLRVARPDLAATVIREVCRSAELEGRSLVVAVHADEALTKAFLSAGASVKFEFLHFAGALSELVSKSA